MKLAISAFLVGSAAAFVPAPKAATTTALNLNGWTADESKFCFGLPGALPPVGEFDPLGFAQTDLGTIKKYREAELQHGRVAMLAAIGMLVTEEPIEFHPLFEANNKDIGPAIRHLDEVRAVEPIFFEILGLIIGALELNRALVGWKKPDAGTMTGRMSSDSGTMFQDLNDDYYPGDVGFDPLGLKPEDPEEFAELHTKELQNGRLAMLGVAGMVAQELVNGKEIFVNLGLAEDRFDAASQAMLPVQF